MPLLTPTPFSNPFGYWNGNLQTVLPSLLRKIPSPYIVRERITTPDDDFLDLDKTTTRHNRLAIVLHGLEGNASRHYVKGTIRYMQHNGWDGIGYHCRTCSGELNKQPRFYHHADSQDLAVAIQHILQNTNYEYIVLIGFSMGGNILTKYLAEQGNSLSPRIKVGVAISSPYQLKDVALEIEKKGKRFYNDKFVKKMVEKALRKKAILKDKMPISVEQIKSIRTCRDFDRLITAPFHGFADVDDFYKQGSMSTHIAHVPVPLLLLTAQNDPILPPSCYPFDKAEKLSNFYLEVTPNGGHVGFCMKNSTITYAERRIAEFCNEKCL